MKYVIFDLDATVIDSSHRQITKADGSLDLDAWKRNSTKEMIMRDSLLPLAIHWKQLMKIPKKVKIGVCTARFMSQDDLAYLDWKGLKFDTLMSRIAGDNRPDYIMKRDLLLHFMRQENIKNYRDVTFYDDNRDVLTMLHELGVKARDSVITNFSIRKA